MNDKSTESSADAKPEARPVDLNRRAFIGTMAAAGTSMSMAFAAAPADEHAQASARPVAAPIHLNVNGIDHELMVDPRVTLLDALRDHLQLTGTKKGCDRGQCGACTVIVGGRRINACLTLAIMQDGASIVTVEGLGQGDRLGPIQLAFLEHDAFQCGYCTPGQLCSATALLNEIGAGQISAVSGTVGDLTPRSLTDVEIRERMSGNLCRCGAYSNIVAAIREVAGNAAVAT